MLPECQHCTFFGLHNDPQFLRSSYEMSGSLVPLNDPPEPVPHGAGTNAAPDPSQPVDKQVSPDILYFFTEVEFPTAADDDNYRQRVCKLCMYVWMF
jgi:hypothetical protein